MTGETTHIRENGATSGIGVLATFAYDDLGRRTSLTLGNGLATTYAYDAVSRFDELKLELPGTADDLVSEFAYNPAGQIASNLRSNDAYSWTSHGSGSRQVNGRRHSGQVRKEDGNMSVKIIIEVFLLLMSIWSAHLAGAMYYKSGSDRSLRLAAIGRSIISIVAGGLALAI